MKKIKKNLGSLDVKQKAMKKNINNQRKKIKKITSSDWESDCSLEIVCDL